MGATQVLYLRLESVIIKTSFAQRQFINPLYYLLKEEQLHQSPV
jgi:hypothetical protein